MSGWVVTQLCQNQRLVRCVGIVDHENLLCHGGVSPEGDKVTLNQRRDMVEFGF